MLVQHLVTIALGGGFRAEELFAEVTRALGLPPLTRAEFQWALDFVERGGESLHAYPEYHRVVATTTASTACRTAASARATGCASAPSSADASMQVKYLSGARIGTIEEGFIARLRPGDCFVFAGRLLEFVRVREMTAYVRRADGNKGMVRPGWAARCRCPASWPTRCWR